MSGSKTSTNTAPKKSTPMVTKSSAIGNNSSKGPGADKPKLLKKQGSSGSNMTGVASNSRQNSGSNLVKASKKSPMATNSS
eukprot:CAMPEP_0176392470 /NCGR_PEP_ID=MMETSP0126-20121128/40895_1 /TAXON_ID=141414 ORGANISM="Strombidinopsis acuminatum, Strain SPMC142" /NCGR_SAMPLE_ID=MMETSP0126 /ASSEMBLY_ACC=CAM_ASM_000229 /LENGTH=80 /DNA_ID=CAMNT_0017763289 /DNA_START=222 /DNA_END=464 /DNA_ORIENTATION=-